MHLQPEAVIFLLCAQAVSGCGAGDRADSGDNVVVRDSAGIEIVHSEAPLWNEGDAWRISPEPVLSIGEADGSPEYRFFRISDAFWMPDGRIAVVNRGTAELRFYSDDGVHLRTAGGKGEGPGEFQGRITVALLGDSLLVFDPALNRLSIMDLNGQFLASRRLAPTGDPVRPIRMYALAGVIPGRGLLMLPNAFPADMKPQPTVYWDSLANLLYSFDGALLDTLGGFSGMDMYSTPRRSGALRFGSVTSAEVHDGRLYIGHAHQYEIEVYAPDGSLIRIIRKRATPVWGEDVIDGLLARAEASAEPSGIPPEALAEYRHRLETEPFAQTLPFYDDLAVDAAGNIWVQRHGRRRPGGPAVWDVFSASGRWLGTVDLPGNFSPHEIGRDYVLGVWQDEFDVEYVHMYELVK